MFNKVRRSGSIASVIALTMLAVDVANAGTASVTYVYDQLGRVTAAIYDNGTCIAYTYDAAGNRTTQTNSASASATTWGSAVWGCSRWTASLGLLDIPAPGGRHRSLAVQQSAPLTKLAFGRSPASVAASAPPEGDDAGRQGGGP